MGFDGISRYMINLDDRKHLIQEILDLLDIDIEWNNILSYTLFEGL